MVFAKFNRSGSARRYWVIPSSLTFLWREPHITWEIELSPAETLRRIQSTTPPPQWALDLSGLSEGGFAMFEPRSRDQYRLDLKVRARDGGGSVVLGTPSTIWPLDLAMGTVAGIFFGGIYLIEGFAPQQWSRILAGLITLTLGPPSIRVLQLLRPAAAVGAVDKTFDIDGSQAPTTPAAASPARDPESGGAGS